MDVVCTAGHVDHGKSTLVRALTGMEPDRFAEEQRRGLTIDIGFGWTTMRAGDRTRTVAFVDLPGHERFIANMLAGAGPAQAALLVVAANEGWRRQSAEHLDILDLLGIRCGVIAITKTDTVDDERLAQVRAEVADNVAGRSLGDAAVVAVSAETGAGLDDLRLALLTALSSRGDNRPDGAARLWVDRAFTVTGAGTVVTGTLTGGTLHTGDEVVVVPSQRRGRVRGLQSLKTGVEAAAPGDRVAVNISGLDVGEVGRGMVVAHLNATRPTAAVDVALRTLEGERVGRRGAWHLHAGTGEWTVRVQPLDGPGVAGEGFVRVLLAEPAPLAPGDRVVLRDAGRRTTVAGGRILDAAPPALRGRAQRLARVTQLELRLPAVLAGDLPALVRLHTAERGAQPAAEVAAALGLTPARAAGAAATAGVLTLGGAWADPAAATRWSAAVRQALGKHHEAHPVDRSAPRSVALQAAVKAGCPPTLAADLLAVLVGTGRIETVGAGVRLAGHAVRLSPDQQRQADALLAALNETPFSPPRLRDAAAAAGAGPALIKELEASGTLVRLGPDLVMTATAVDQAAAVLRRRYAEHGPLTPAQAKEFLSTSRKYALPLLEELDRRGITRRNGDVRDVA